MKEAEEQVVEWIGLRIGNHNINQISMRLSSLTTPALEGSKPSLQGTSEKVEERSTQSTKNRNGVTII